MSIAVAMSGGVDSSTVAALLAEQNSMKSSSSAPEVVGLTMQLWNQRRLPPVLGEEAGDDGHASGRCCSLDDVYDARAVATFLNIPYYVVNLEKQFEAAVVRPFVEGYLAGETPISCSLCNTEIKFAQFLTTARQIGATRIATGHYARVRQDGKTGRYQLLRGVDRSKDQAYFLFGLTQEQLAHSEFPLGGMTKQEVRAIARARRLPVAEKPDSQEICFVPTGSYRQFIDAYLAEQQRERESAPGEVISTATSPRAGRASWDSELYRWPAQGPGDGGGALYAALRDRARSGEESSGGGRGSRPLPQPLSCAQRQLDSPGRARRQPGCACEDSA